MKVIGITGGIASGKSLATAFLSRRFGVPVIDADHITHELLATGGAGVPLIVEAFGDGYLDRQGKIDRQSLGRLVFKDSKARKQLNQILHPLIRAEVEHRLEELRKKRIPVALVSAALILEEKLERHYDDVIIVIASPELQIERLVENKGMSNENAQLRVDSQWDNSKRNRTKYFKVHNLGKAEKFETELEKTWLQLATKHGFDRHQQ